MHQSGLLLCAKYAVAPNLFGYCGPDDNKNIVDHLKENRSDEELIHLLSDFETLYPYLRMIAADNRIDDPFDRKAVEAYWLGNSLLNNVKKSSYRSLLEEKIVIGKRLDKEKAGLIKHKIANNAFLPNHAFHVFNIFKRTGNDPSRQTVTTMDQCRISWGMVTQNSKCKTIFVKTRTLINQKGKLLLGNEIIKNIQINFHGKQFIKDFNVGEWVSFHWEMICDKLTTPQIKNLEYYTQRAIDFYNG